MPASAVSTERLIEALHALEEGDLSYHIEPHPADDREVADLIAAFNRMADAVTARERSLRGANERLTQVNHTELDMLGFVSHQLKNLIAPCLLNACALLDGLMGELSEPQRKVVTSIVRNIEYADEMVRRFLDLSRIEQPDQRVEPQRLNLMADIVAPALDRVERPIREKKMNIEKRWPDGDVTVNADPQLMRVIFDNLIGNALKYGREGGMIRIRGNHRAHEYEFGVWNDGVGIPKSRLSELFRKFHRLNQANLPKRRGSGLGLYVTKTIIERHGGTIRAESVEGEWVEFVFTLPKPD